MILLIYNNTCGYLKLTPSIKRICNYFTFAKIFRTCIPTEYIPKSTTVRSPQGGRYGSIRRDVENFILMQLKAQNTDTNNHDNSEENND